MTHYDYYPERNLMLPRNTSLVLAAGILMLCQSLTYAGNIDKDLARIVELEQFDEVVGSEKILLAHNNTSSKKSFNKPKSTATTQEAKKLPASAGTKAPFSIKRGDAVLTIGAKTKIEHFYQDNMYLLNTNIPDENEYFKHTLDLLVDLKYGKEKYGHDAIQLYTNLRNKSIWGKAASFADKESGPVGPSSVRLANTIFGAHSHSTGKPLIYIKEAWLQFSLNAALNIHSENIHMLKLGWFPFELGRGIALGSCYGLNKELIGLYNYSEDKGAPGINLTGTLIKDMLTYDLYYAKFEERNKSLSDTINEDKRHWVGRSGTPWRGVNKDDELIAARLKITPLPVSNRYGKLEVEPYIFYNEASDQVVEIAPDSRTQLGSLGVAVEYAYKNFEYGGEVAINYGKETLYAIDRNQAGLTNDGTGQIIEQYSKVSQAGPIPAKITSMSKAFITNPAYQTNGATDGTYTNASDRFRPFYQNHFGGWMGVVDAAYNFKNYDLKVAVAYGYASGDQAPHDLNNETNKTYRGFIGLHEIYSGKRVRSVLLLDERLLLRPVSLPDGGGLAADTDMSFSDLQHAGFGANWTPKFFKGKDLSINPNVMFFWKAHGTNKFNANAQPPATTDERARHFMGTEMNILSRCTLIKDLAIFANLAMFIPGGYFTDVKGISLSGQYINRIADNIVADQRNDITDPTMFKLSDDTAYHVNVGFEFKF
jgi:hypothetical protein